MDYTNIPEEIYKERDDICTPLKVGESVSLRKVKNNITYFCYHQLGIKPYAWQHMVFKEVMKNHKNILACTPRQVGKTFAVSVIALHHVIYNRLPIKSKGNRTIIGIVSRSENQSKKIIEDIRSLIDIGDQYVENRYGVKKWLSSMISKKQTDTNNKTHLTFRKIITRMEGNKKVKSADGNIIGEIVCVPATESARGFTFSKLLMDEAAFFENEEFYTVIAEPTLRSTNGHSIVTTTPNGQRGWFFEVFDPYDEHDNNHWSRFWLHWNHIEDDKEKESVLMKKQELESHGKVKQFEQEYEAKFTADSKSFFDPEKVDMMFDSTLAKWEKYPKKTDLGIDVGFKTSRSVITITRLGDDGIIRRVWHYEYPEFDDKTIVDDIKDLIKRFNVQRVIIDDCPAASYIIQKLKSDGKNIKLMNFKKYKTDKYVQFRAKMYQGKILSYPDKQLASQMKALEEVEGARNTRVEKSKSAYDDSIDSFLISSYFFLEDKKGLNFYDWDEIEETK